ncbi:AAA family ATPase [Desulfonema magnum]|uniref:AAA ATPase-like domain-containing protein n=1 Tax=Desulfonema magnum TaxID=45655 RepID=A0A975GTK7_9BACT|nr:AAA family ATPase [Desulfonema magnum]QTA92248.1 AAA ATPase-like domain-containing protein [Desulfonema magnum]
MKFPYGVCDFYKIITNSYFYVDRTDRIPLIEEAGEHLLFLRPRRFGKSLLLSVLKNYYDIARADDFERLFGGLAVGKNPTDRHHQYFVLEWDFSAVSPHGEPEQIQQRLYDYVNSCIRAFSKYYREFLTEEIIINPTDAQDSLQSLLTAVRQTDHRLYLLIDEYDNFANEVMMGTRKMREDRDMLVPAMNRDEARHASRIFYRHGDMGPLSDFIEQRCFSILDNRDYRWADELTVKTAFLMLLFNDTLYITDSETELGRGYADLTMILRPDMRHYQLPDVLMEFKYVSLKNAGLNGAELRDSGRDEITKLEPVKEKLAESESQLKRYGRTLEKTYGDVLRLRAYSVVSLGFERLVWRELPAS